MFLIGPNFLNAPIKQNELNTEENGQSEHVGLINRNLIGSTVHCVTDKYLEQNKEQCLNLRVHLYYKFCIFKQNGQVSFLQNILVLCEVCLSI